MLLITMRATSVELNQEVLLNTLQGGGLKSKENQVRPWCDQYISGRTFVARKLKGTCKSATVTTTCKRRNIKEPTST